MVFIRRSLEREIRAASRGFSAVILTGPRRSGKTTLLKHLFPNARYHLLEEPDTLAHIQIDPRGFVASLTPPAILDEVQNVPQIFNYLRARIDTTPDKKGQWFITGSQEAPLMRGVTESMAGRAGIFQLWPLSVQESPKVSLFHGGFPEVLSRPSQSGHWFRSYIQTYLERDVRSIAAIRDLGAFRRFLSLAAARSGQVLNRTDMAAPLGLSVPTVSEWLNILEVTSQIIFVQPYFENFGKRVVKSPKIYFTDSGLLRFLLGFESQDQLLKSPFYGSLFEGFVASEIAKHQINSGKQKEIYYFRDRQGLEVDFVVPLGEGRLGLLEAKTSSTFSPAAIGPLLQLQRSIRRHETKSFLIHPGTYSREIIPLQNGLNAVPAQKISSLFNR